MTRGIKPILSTLVFICVLAVIFITNSLFSGRLDNIIPTYKGRAVFHENGREMNITNESFSQPFLDFHGENNIFQPVTQGEYDTISQCHFFEPLMEMIEQEITSQDRQTEQIKELMNRMYQSMVFTIDKDGHKKYYVMGGFRSDNVYKELITVFTPEKSVELFVCFDGMAYAGKAMTYPSKLKDDNYFNNSFKQTIINKAVRYMNSIVHLGLTDLSSELHFSTKSIMVDGNMCLIQDSASQVTVYYNWANEKVVGFQKNR